MTLQTYFVVQAFEFGKAGRVKALPAVQAQSRGHAARMAERLAEKGGAIAFCRDADADIGIYEEPEIIGVFGEIPEDALDAMAA